MNSRKKRRLKLKAKIYAILACSAMFLVVLLFVLTTTHIIRVNADNSKSVIMVILSLIGVTMFSMMMLTMYSHDIRAYRAKINLWREFNSTVIVINLAINGNVQAAIDYHNGMHEKSLMLSGFLVHAKLVSNLPDADVNLKKMLAAFNPDNIKF